MLYARVIGTNKTRICSGTSINLKQDLRLELNATLGKTRDLLLRKRKQLARGLEVWRATTDKRTAE